VRILVGDERLLERLGRMVPGYAGYKEKEQRREADKRQRMHLVRLLEKEQQRLESVKADLVTKKSLDAVGNADTIGRRFERLIDRIRFASYGYAGFFDAEKVKEDKLDRVYEFDSKLIEDVGKISGKMGEIESASEVDVIRDRLLELERILGEVNTKFNQREEILKGFA
jgi:hypothetical protein